MRSLLAAVKRLAIWTSSAGAASSASAVWTAAAWADSDLGQGRLAVSAFFAVVGVSASSAAADQPSLDTNAIRRSRSTDCPGRLLV